MADNTEHPVSTTDSLEARLDAEQERSGAASVVRRAVSLLSGGYEGEDFLRVVGGDHAEGILGGAPALYWPEVWGARALLYVWDDSAAPAVIAGLRNQAWRVREMCAKVCAERRIGTAAELSRLTTDERPRVRSAGAHALAAVGDAGTGDGTAERLTAMLRDPDKNVRRSAQQALAAFTERSA
ncbi:HEAT repeat domain-containing protein [Subtercola endophyticus]|uniref:HEAT repeat domain-containing protein n=1 Tax=Subtercola endophyticus TaxID=2895559 RepID=UPI001E5B00F4|nr:HEAT repeat domain-containing protein [Subtercola endophyticus]UFS60181.1 HEAT repeat domain-containing protein [Subtercola endophyticus]